MLFHQTSVEVARPFFAARAPGLPIAADPDAVFYDGFGLARGSARELIGPRVWLRAFRAMLKGHFVGRPTSDTLRMPGAFLCVGRDVIWQHRARHAGDLPDLAAMRRALCDTESAAREAG